MCRRIIFCLLIAAAVTGCGVRRYLPAGERLYRGATINLQRDSAVTTSEKLLRKELMLAAKPGANKFALGRPYKVWWWFVIGEPRRPKGIRAFFRNKLGEPPVLSSNVNARVTAINMQAFLENLGYFHSVVTGDTVNHGYMASAVYNAHILPQYKIKNITWISDSSDLMAQLQNGQRNGILRPGNGYRLSDIQAERERLDLYIKTKGYYYFNPDYIMSYADSSIGNNEVNLYLNLKRSIPENARHAFTINRITIFPNYTLLLAPPDTSKTGTTNIDGLLLRDTVHKFNPNLFKHVITYRPGAIYNSTEQNTTLNRLINLGTFKYARNRFEQTTENNNPYGLNVYYYLTPAKKKSLQGAIDGFSKENKFFGAQASVSWRNRNTFKGAQLLIVRMYGGMEVSFSDSVKNAIDYRAGIEASLNLPRFYLPLIRIKQNSLYAPRTRLLVGYEYFRKSLFYTKNIYRLQYEFNWKESSNKQHTIVPFSLTYIRAGNVTNAFSKEVALNPYLSANLYSETILGSNYTYTFNTANPFEKTQWYFKTSLDLAGNLAGLLSGAKEPREKEILNAAFAQYVKADVDLRYQRRLINNFDWVNRLLIGIGVPYNNSNILPFSKQYVIGGSSSLRGFQMRQIGPGSHQPTLEDQRYVQLIGGDYKLQVNSELRMPIFAKVSGTVFVDIGNIWTKDTLLFGKAGQLKKDFYKELAVATGVGVRFDAGLILLRLDMGVPLRKPYLPEGQRWVFNQIQPAYWKNNLVFNIALGYPF